MSICIASESHLRQILNALRDEYDEETGEGFYGNRNIIASVFMKVLSTYTMTCRMKLKGFLSALILILISFGFEKTRGEAV